MQEWFENSKSGTPKKLFFLIVLLGLTTLTLGCAQNFQKHQVTSSNFLNNATAGKANSTLGNSTVANLLPDGLMGMHKFVALKGKLALEFVKKSHRGPIKYVKDIALVHYLGNNSMMLVWITEYPSAEVAENQTLLMVKGMKKFGSVWESVNETSFGKLKVYYVPAKNQYFFYKGKYMIYLIPVNMDRSAVENFALKVYSILP